MLEYKRLNTLPQRYEHFAQVKLPVRDRSGEIVPDVFLDGVSSIPTYPAEAEISMDPEWPGMQLPGLVANTSSMLVIHRAFKQLIEQWLRPQDHVEFLPLSILNHKRRLASADYFIVNPIGTLDCLDQKRSSFSYTSDGRLFMIEKYVLDSKKLAWEPAIFRPKEAPTEYIINGKITTAFKESGFPDRNVFVESLEIV